MRPGAPLIAALAVVAGATAVAGCAGSGDADRAAPAPAAVRLAAVVFPQTPFVARADAPPRAVRAADARARRAAAEVPAAPADRGSAIAPGAPSDDEVRAQLEELYGTGGGGGADTDDAGLGHTVVLNGGLVTAPPDAPPAVQKIVEGANQVARLPYVYGGGHGRADGLFVDSAYDCSGSVSFALANAGLLDRPLVSGELARWGEPGPGRWVTIYANAGHAFMVVGGARFDTVGLRQSGSRWQGSARTTNGFTVVHPPGL